MNDDPRSEEQKQSDDAVRRRAEARRELRQSFGVDVPFASPVVEVGDAPFVPGPVEMPNIDADIVIEDGRAKVVTQERPL